MLLIHWQPLYISCHWNSILLLADINKYSYFEYKLIYMECDTAGIGLMLFNNRKLWGGGMSVGSIKMSKLSECG